MGDRGGDERIEPRPSPRNKRAEIIAVATEFFGDNGYEETKWADVASAVGLGPTALYHYFESKQHCLFEILVEAVDDALEEFTRLNQGDFRAAFPAVVRGGFERSDHDVRRARVLVAEQALVRHPREAAREEDARRRAFARLKRYEEGWRELLGAGMAAGSIPAVDVDLLTRAVIGAYNSVWQWYRPDGRLELDEVADLYVPRLMALVGIPE
ncbi:MAG TPA: TetR/AcrR family transcriptional regulator [Solirubrobacterales bacterium]